MKVSDMINESDVLVVLIVIVHVVLTEGFIEKIFFWLYFKKAFNEQLVSLIVLFSFDLNYLI
jgi:hypothetical protein